MYISSVDLLISPYASYSPQTCWNSTNALLNSWNILFLDTKVRYWLKICWTFASFPYLMVQFFNFDSVSCKNATMQHYKYIKIDVLFMLIMSTSYFVYLNNQTMYWFTLCSRNLSLTALMLALWPIPSNRVIKLISCSLGTPWSNFMSLESRAACSFTES